MSQENLEVVRSIFAAWERGDYHSAEWAHPGIALVVPDGPAPGSWTGVAAMAEAWRQALSAFEELRSEADEYRVLDDERVLVLMHFSGRGKTSGLEVGDIHMKGANLFHVQGGMVTRLVLYWDRERALEAVGLSQEAMSQENVEAVRRAIDAFNARDLDGFLDVCDPQVELHSRFTEVGGVYQRYGGLRRWHQDLMDSWEYLQIELEQLINIDADTMVVLMTLHGKGRGSGLEIRQPIAHIDAFRAGKLTRIVTYTDREEALEAVGLRE